MVVEVIERKREDAEPPRPLDENLDVRRDALSGASCDRILEDTISGTNTKWPDLTRALDLMASLVQMERELMVKPTQAGWELQALPNPTHRFPVDALNQELATARRRRGARRRS